MNVFEQLSTLVQFLILKHEKLSNACTCFDSYYVNAPKTYVKKNYKILSMHWFSSQPTNLSSDYQKIGS